MMVSEAYTPTASSTPKRPQPSPLWTGKRFYVALFLFTNLLINYMDRTSLSVAAPTIAKQFKWDPGKVGLAFSSVLWAYCLCLIPWGWLSDRIGTRRVNGISVTIWSVGTMLSGAVQGFGSMLSAALILGAGESASMPTAGKVVRQWFPPSERGLATAIFNAGTFAGPALAAPTATWMLIHFGWRMTFVAMGLLGLVWVLLWLRLFAVPAECHWLTENERDFILSETSAVRDPAPRARKVLRKLLGRKTMWGLFVTQGCCAYSMYLFLFWLPSYLVQSRHMELMRASWFVTVPYLVATVLVLVSGKLSDRVLTPEALRQGKRRTLLVIFILLSSVILATNAIGNEYAVVALISVALTFIASALTMNIAMANDLVWNADLAGSALGVLILGGNCFGLLAPVLTGYIVKWTGRFDSAFYLAGGLLLVGAVTSLTATRKPISFADKP